MTPRAREIALKYLTLGEITICRVIESEAPFLTPAELFPDAPAEVRGAQRSWLEPWALCPKSGALILPIQSYLVQTRHHKILIDSCVGNRKSFDWFKPWHDRRETIWLDNLGACGLGPADIDIVLCSHLHVDHCGWNTQLIDGRWVPTFPKAKYVISKAEYESSRKQGSSTYRENVAPIVEAGQAVLVEMDYQLDDQVRLLPTPGHTDGHVSVLLSSQGREAVMCGDVIHSPVQCRFPDWRFFADADAELARKTRLDFLARSCETGNLVLTAHFPSPSAGHVIARGDAYDFRFLDEMAI